MSPSHWAKKVEGCDPTVCCSTSNSLVGALHRGQTCPKVSCEYAEVSPGHNDSDSSVNFFSVRKSVAKLNLHHPVQSWMPCSYRVVSLKFQWLVGGSDFSSVEATVWSVHGFAGSFFGRDLMPGVYL